MRDKENCDKERHKPTKRKKISACHHVTIPGQISPYSSEGTNILGRARDRETLIKAKTYSRKGQKKESKGGRQYPFGDSRRAEKRKILKKKKGRPEGRNGHKDKFNPTRAEGGGKAATPNGTLMEVDSGRLCVARRKRGTLVGMASKGEKKHAERTNLVKQLHLKKSKH